MNAHLEAAAALVNYDAVTGRFTRAVSTGSRWRAGQPVGGLDAKGYVVLNVGGKPVKAHRLAWFIIHGEVPSLLDHINGDKADNRIANLRSATKSVNCLNSWSPRSNNLRTGLQGVTKISGRSKRWAARIRVNGKRIHLGSFATPEEAGRAYVTAKRELLGALT